MKKKINHPKSSQNPTEIQEKIMSEFLAPHPTAMLSNTLKVDLKSVGPIKDL